MYISRVRIHPDRFPTYERYPFSLPVLQNTPEINLTAPVSFFVGENGAGKSTLLRAIAERYGIHIWQDTDHFRFERNPFREQLKNCIELDGAEEKAPGAFFGADIFEFFTEILDEWAESDPGQLKYFGGKSLRAMSHGQSLLTFFRNRYKIPGMYLLDEPETALSPRSQLELLAILQDMSSHGSAQFLIASHSPILLACPRAAIFSFDTIPVGKIAYQDTDHYRMYLDFLKREEARLLDKPRP